MVYFVNNLCFFVNCAIFHELYDRMRFEVNCAKLHHHVISKGLPNTNKNTNKKTILAASSHEHGQSQLIFSPSFAKLFELSGLNITMS